MAAVCVAEHSGADQFAQFVSGFHGIGIRGCRRDDRDYRSVGDRACTRPRMTCDGLAKLAHDQLVGADRSHDGDGADGILRASRRGCQISRAWCGCTAGSAASCGRSRRERVQKCVAPMGAFGKPRGGGPTGEETRSVHR